MLYRSKEKIYFTEQPNGGWDGLKINIITGLPLRLDWVFLFLETLFTHQANRYKLISNKQDVASPEYSIIIAGVEGLNEWELIKESYATIGDNVSYFTADITFH